MLARNVGLPDAALNAAISHAQSPLLAKLENVAFDCRAGGSPVAVKPEQIVCICK
jgi:hypothetical protein